MKMTLDHKELENVNGGSIFPFMMRPEPGRRGNRSSDNSAEEAEPELTIEVSSHPGGILGEIADAQDKMMTDLQPLFSAIR